MALLDHKRRLSGAQRVSLDSIRRVGQFEVVRMLEIGQAAARAQAVELRFFLFNVLYNVRQHGRSIADRA